MDDEKMTWRDRYSQITGGISSVQNAVHMFRDAKSKYNEKFLYTAVLEENAYVYEDMMKFIDSKSNGRNFKFISNRYGIWRYYDSDATTTFYVEGHKIKVNLRKPRPLGPTAETGGIDDFFGGSSASGKEELIFVCRDAEGLKALERLMMKFTDDKQVDKKSCYIVNTDKWGDWDYENLPEKSMDSVFLPEGVKESIIHDLEVFFSKEERFKKLGMPYHRGYAFYGEPGNGKSSIALALANHFELDLFNLPLSTVKDDSALLKSIAGIKSKSILLLEDIDIFSETMNRTGTGERPTLAGLLNALDGVSTPSGLVTIMTTNRFESLDSALIRPGRMDFKLELKSPVKYQIESMFNRVFDEPMGIEPKQFTSMAAVADVFKRNLDDPEAVRMELKNEK